MATVLRGGWVLTMDGRDRELPVGDVLFDNGLISAVDQRVDEPEGTEVVDAAGMLVLPGLVDTHRHTWQTPLRQLGAQWSLSDYLTGLLGTIGARFRPSDVYAGTLCGALAAVDAGITTLVDWAHIQHSPAHSDASVAALRDAGIRAVFAHSGPIRPGERRSSHPDDIRRVRAELLADDSAPVTLAMGARGPDFTDLDTTTADFALARDLGIPITVHVAGGRADSDRRGIATLHRGGLLGPDVTLVHANGAPEQDLRLLADHGGTVSISPQIELTMPGLGAGVAIRRMLDAGLLPGLSVDSESVAASDLFTQMRFALAAHRLGGPDDETPLQAREVLRMATRYGAEVAGLGDRVGSLEPGRAADLVLVRTDTIGLVPLRRAADAMVLAAHPGMVDTVIVAGRTLKRDGRLLADLTAVRDLVADTAEWATAG